jgi:hypothetical protein
MKVSDGGGTKSKKKAKKKPDTDPTGKMASVKAKTAAAKKAAAARQARIAKTRGAQKFAADQLTKAGIKPKAAGHGVIAQFSAENKKAAAKRTKAGLGTIRGTGAGSSLTAGEKKGLPRVKPTPEQFATQQLTRAGIKVKKGDVTAQFRAANKVAAQKRRAAHLVSARATGHSSSLTAGMRGPKIEQSAAQKRRGTGTPASQKPKPAVKPSAAKIKAQGGGT